MNKPMNETINELLSVINGWTADGSLINVSDLSAITGIHIGWVSICLKVAEERKLVRKERVGNNIFLHVTNRYLMSL